MKRIMKTLLWGVIILALTVFIYSAWRAISIYGGYRSAEKRYDSLAQSVTAQGAEEGSGGESGAAAQDAPVRPDGQPEEGAETAPVYAENSPVYVDFDELKELGPDVIGWIYLPDTVINYPVVRAQDNEYYLTRFIDGRESSGGSIFADCACAPDFSGSNTILYGHNMRNGSMFAPVALYAEQDYYDAHPVMYINTPTQNYKLVIFSGFTTQAETFAYQTEFASDQEYAEFLSAVCRLSDIKCGVVPGPEARIVTLSTCVYVFDDARFLLFGYLVPIG